LTFHSARRKSISLNTFQQLSSPIRHQSLAHLKLPEYLECLFQKSETLKLYNHMSSPCCSMAQATFTTSRPWALNRSCTEFPPEQLACRQPDKKFANGSVGTPLICVTTPLIAPAKVHTAPFAFEHVHPGLVVRSFCLQTAGLKPQFLLSAPPLTQDRQEKPTSAAQSNPIQ